MPKGITASIYKWQDRTGRNIDASAGGISGRCHQVTVIGCPDGEIFDATPEAPAVKLVHRVVFGRTVVHAEPVDRPPGKGAPMAGGTFIGTSDSRFSALSGIYGAVALHDRFEY